MNEYIGRQFGNYRIVRKLASGSFGTVYLAEHLHLERLAAIKILHVLTELNALARDKFLHEARVHALLQHPHIIHILDFGFDGSVPYMVMDYASNGTLRALHPRGTRVSAEHIVSYVNQIASALHYAHEQHVIHRDVKPENILLNSKRELVLSDFGVAIVQPTLDSLSTQGPAGTPLYMAPEQISGKPCPASDQYALGVMVYEWLCGEPPFRGPSMAAFLQHIQNPPPSLCARLPHLSPAVEDVVLGALAKNPQHRFSSVQDFATMLEEAFYATQPLSLGESVEHGTQDETMRPMTPVRLVPMTRGPDPTDDDSTEPRLKTIRPVVSQQQAPVSIMCVCASPDQMYLEQWETHLRPLELAGYLTVWSERHVLAGMDRAQQINQHLEQADLLVLLLSADFFVCSDCIALMNRALPRHQHGKARIIPLLLRPVAWQESPLAALSCLPSNHLPVAEWTHQDAAFDACVQEIRRLIGRPIITPPRQPQTLTPALPNQNRQRLLQRVRSFWITGVLEQSLHGAALMALGLQEQPDAIPNPWHLIMQHPQSAPQSLPTGTRILQVYDASNGELLILGAPGSGKTTLLLELTRDLLKRAERDEQQPLPMVFSLSSWTMKQPSLVDWLVQELASKYQVPRKLGQRLIEMDQILPLLDGLDEVNAQDRTACIESINTYREEHGLLPLVVCSRSADYLEQTARVRLANAVAIQPLSQQQVNTYLTSAGTALQALQVALSKNPALRELTQTPLMLSMLTLTYYNIPVQDVLRMTSTSNQVQQVVERYVDRMLSRGGSVARYSSPSVKRWLTFLAKELQKRGQPFYLERLQPDWLMERNANQRYTRIVVGVIFGLLGLFALGPISGYIILVNSMFSYALPLSAYVLSWALLFGFINGILYPVNRAGPTISNKRRRWQNIIRSIQNGLIAGLLIGCPTGFIQSSDHILIGVLTIGGLVGIIGGLTSGLIDALLNMQPETIQPAETVRWSWTSMEHNLVKFLGLGMLCVLLLGLLLGLVDTAVGGGQLVDTVQWGLGVAEGFIPYFALLGPLTGGLTVPTTLLKERDITRPNLGLHRSARHSVLVGIISASAVVVIAILLAPLLGPSAVLPLALSVGPLVGLVNALRAGGTACIQHLVLRWLLWRKKKMPWRYVRFLNYASERVLLRKVGGGYMFVHRFLLEYFASLK
jgi:serine/threonine protein kinase